MSGEGTSTGGGASRAGQGSGSFDRLLAPRWVPSIELEASEERLDDGSLRTSKMALYTSHALSAWGSRAWEFAVALLLLHIKPDSLTLVALFGLLEAALAVVFGSTIGAYIDREERLRAACTMYLLQNSMVVLSCGAALALLARGAGGGGGPADGALSWLLLGVVVVAGALSSLGALGAMLSVEREWVKVLCALDSAGLAATNAAMKRIDLCCLVASPIAVGLLMTYGGPHPMAAATAVILAWNIAAWAPECLLLRRARAHSTSLSAARAVSGDAATRAMLARSPLHQQLRSWATYADQACAPAGVSLALLYFTVLSFGALMTAYLKWLGMQEAELSLYRGLGAVSGILATVTFPVLRRRVGLVATGAASVWLQLACLALATAPAALSAVGFSVAPAAVLYPLVWGLAFSRFGLWSFDLCVNQAMQETVEVGALGVVCGVQSSLQSLLQMAAYGAGVVVWEPELFPWLMVGSCVVVGSAALLFAFFSASTSMGRTLGLDQDHGTILGIAPER